LIQIVSGGELRQELGENHETVQNRKVVSPHHLQTPVARDDFTISKYKLILRDLME
jgi:hypothetical protein